MFYAPLSLPFGQTEERIQSWLGNWCVEGGPPAEMRNYLAEDFKRFLYTLSLVPSAEGGKLLEIGSNPYYMSMLLRKFRRYSLSLSNYFGPGGRQSTQTMVSTAGERVEMPYRHFNVEVDPLPYEDGEFDVVLFCEVLEHMMVDPLTSLLELKRCLKPDGVLVVSTPNVCRMENIARLLSGANLYDPYSGYGPYGRHNREFNRHELHQLLTHAGFEVETSFTSDVHASNDGYFFKFEEILGTLSKLPNRTADLGQYLFFRSRNARPGNRRRPSWLYRSFPADQME